MLKITIPPVEMWDEKKEEFVLAGNPITLQLEHSLVSISKWESKWKKPYYGQAKKTSEELLDYVRCMTITQNVDPSVYTRLNLENLKVIINYIDDPMTATTFSSDRQAQKNRVSRRRETITSELVYYWMISYNIPHEYEKWHINRLLTLIRVCGVKNATPKKKSQADLYRENARLNAINRQKFNTKG